VGHGAAKKFLSENEIPESIKIIDLSQDFRLKENASIGNREFVYGLPELNKEAIRSANNIANPGCFATCIQLGLLPLAKAGLLNQVYTTGITGSTGAGQSLTATSHFSWRNNNISAYKTLTHQHLHEIGQSLKQLQPAGDLDFSFIPWRGDFTRGIFVSSHIHCNEELKDLIQLYEDFYQDHPFTQVSREVIFLKQVVNTNKCIVQLEKVGTKLVVHSITDNLLKGASGQAVQNMNLMFGIDECAGLKLKANYFSYTMKLFDVYPINDITIVKARGSYVWDKNGEQYLDLYGGHAVISIGHSHPHYVERVTRQLNNVAFYSNSIRNPFQEELAEKLGKVSGREDYQLFLCNSGAEANENALKLASFTNGRKKIIAFKKSFHGRTSLAVAATDNPAIVAPVNETPNVIFLPFNDEASLEAVFKAQGSEISSVIIEGIQGVGGINVASESFLRTIRRLCTQYGALFIADSVQWVMAAVVNSFRKTMPA
jgi:N-acetyl-gamma-glutamyl-phosphate reductase (EC 1.2.1.38)